jgi:phytoene dehydrogenase-like protein
MSANNGLSNHSAGIAVVGGGIAGLTAAAHIARSGRSVTLFEQSKQLGGRGATNIRDDIHFNLGGHALYCAGHAFENLQELGVPFTGAFPNPGKSQVTLGTNKHELPYGVMALLKSRLFSLREKLKVVGLFRKLPKLDPRQVDDVPLGQWISQNAGTGNIAWLLRALFRLATYGVDPGHFSAGAAIEQYQLAAKANVWYIDGGWQSLADGLRQVIRDHGGTVQTGARVDSIQSDEQGATLRMGDGSDIHADAAVLAASPSAVSKLLDLSDDDSLSRQFNEARPGLAACLDVALTKLPRPEERFAIGLDQDMYFSVHSAAVKLGPEGLAVIHVMKYLGPESGDAKSNERECEEFLDLLQPGWRDFVHTRRFLPSMVVTHGIPLASQGGETGRPSVTVPGHDRIFLAGDWVGAAGQLVDASAASGKEAARLALAIPKSQSSRMAFHVAS